MRVLVATVSAVLLVAVPARADTIVYRRGGDVWRMSPDGSHQQAVTRGEQRYEWPSMADDGTVVAADDTGRLHQLTRDGAPLGPPIDTPAVAATEDDPAEQPTHVRISPDGARIAYDAVVGGDPTTLFADGADPGPIGVGAPSWIGNGTLLLTRDVSADDPETAFSLYAGGEPEPWFDDDGAPWASGFDAAASRDGRRIAVLASDGPENDGTPTRLALRLFTAAAPGADVAFRCELELLPTDAYESVSPTWSPDGTRLAWAEEDGIHVASVGALDACGAIRTRVVTLPGAWEPYWSPASDPAAPSAAKPAALTLRVSTTRRVRRKTLAKRGLRARVTVSAPAAVRLSVRVAGTRRFVGHVTRKLGNAGTATITVRLRRTTAKRLVLRASAPGAAPVRIVIRTRA